LTKWVGLSDLVHLEPGDATKLARYNSSSFDAAWSIHVGMNVQDKSSFYSGVANVLKSGAPLVLFDILATGAVVEPHYPTPWAATREQSFLATTDEMSALLEGAGYSIVEIKNQTSEAIAFLDETINKTKSGGGPPPLGLHLVIGPDANEIIPRMRRNLVEGSLAPTVFYARKN
jgi:hypothetical protein